MRDRSLDNPEWSIDVCLYCCVKRLGGQLENIFTLLLTAGVGDDNIQTSQGFHSLRDEFFAIAFLTQVAGRNLGLIMRKLFGIGTPRGLVRLALALILAASSLSRRWAEEIMETEMLVLVR